jgi:hypothetical protein
MRSYVTGQIHDTERVMSGMLADGALFGWLERRPQHAYGSEL